MKYWNAVLRVNDGCTPVNGGCLNCLAAAEAHMRQHNPLVAERYRGLTTDKVFNGTVRVNRDFFLKPLSAKKPKVWQIWNDLFHTAVPSEIICETITLARMRPEHTFICLTKRIERAMDFGPRNNVEFPKNFFLGTSVSCEEDAGGALSLLTRIDAPSKLISFEPAVGLVDFSRALRDTSIKVIIAGGETGPRARVRPCPDSAIWGCMNDCRDAGVSFFFKGWGAHRYGRQLDGQEWSRLPWVL